MKKKHRIVIDTNIFVSGLINPRGACYKLIDHFLYRHFDLILCAEILNEYEFVLRHSALISPDDAAEFLYLLKQAAIFCKIENVLQICIDTSDNKFFETAIAGGANFLVTKNMRHFPLKKYEGLRIVKVSKALTELEKNLSA